MGIGGLNLLYQPGGSRSIRVSLKLQFKSVEPGDQAPSRNPTVARKPKAPGQAMACVKTRTAKGRYHEK
jgi:hypothetical protein